MARQQSFVSSVFYILLSVLALNFIAIALFIVAQWRLGHVTPEDLLNVAWVLVGERKYALNVEEFEEYKRLRDMNEDEMRIKELEEGGAETQARTARALDQQRRQLELEVERAQQIVRQHEEDLVALRASIEGLKNTAAEEQEKLDLLKSERTKVELSERQKKLQTILSGMDAEQLANYFGLVMEQVAGPEEVARMMLTHLPSNLSSEVLANMPVQQVRQIIPLLENEYADMTPESIVTLWTTPNTKDYKIPKQIAFFMKKMPVSKAFTVFTLLPPRIRAELVPLLRTTGSE